MKTEILKPIESNLLRAGSLIQRGGIVAFPTETVYGLGADAFNVEAVKKIYTAKERPSKKFFWKDLAGIERVISAWKN